jgi:hypothetical protein
VQHMRASDVWAKALHGDRSCADDGIPFLDDELVDEPTRPTGMLAFGHEPGRRRAPVDEFEDAVTRVWIRPYAARLRLVAGR